MNNSQSALFGSTAAQDLANERGEKLGAGQWWNVMHLLGELDYLRIQERFVREPLSVEFITTPLFWYYFKRGLAIGLFFASLLLIIRAVTAVTANYISEQVAYPISLMIIAIYVSQLANWIIFRPIHSEGAHTKAVSLVFHAAVASFLVAVATKFIILTILPEYGNYIYEVALKSNKDVAKIWLWIANHFFLRRSIETGILISTIAPIIAAELIYLIRLNIMKRDCQSPKKYAI